MPFGGHASVDQDSDRGTTTHPRYLDDPSRSDVALHDVHTGRAESIDSSWAEASAMLDVADRSPSSS